MKLQLLTPFIAVGTMLASSMNPALADTVVSVNRILNISSVGVGSTTIHGVTVTDDTSQWLRNSTQRLAGAQWQFNNNGTFVFYLPNTRTDVYPITGNYRIQGNILSFQGSRSANTSVSRTTSFVGGNINLNSRQPVMNLQWGTTSITAAVVNGSSFGSNKTSAYNATVLIQRVR